MRLCAPLTDINTLQILKRGKDAAPEMRAAKVDPVGCMLVRVLAKNASPEAGRELISSIYSKSDMTDGQN
jgi:hypothetical protein